VAALKNLFGKDVQVDKLPAELKTLIEQMRHERTVYEALVKRSEQLHTAVAPLQQKLAQLEQRLAPFDKLAGQVDQFQKNAESLEESQRSTSEGLEQARAFVQATQGELDGLKGQLAEVVAAKAELPGVLELVKPLGALRSETSTIEQRVQDLSRQLEQVQSRHEQIAGDSAAGLARLAKVEQGLTSAAGRVDGFATRAETLESTFAQLQQLLKEVPDVKRELSTLNVLAEYVTRKVAAIESQKEMVERATQRAERLTELTSQVDRQLQEQHENAKFLERLETNVDEIKKLHETALQHAGEVDKQYKGLDEGSRRLAADFAAQRDALKQAVGNFTFDREGLEALSQRITELRTAVSATERQLPALEEARAGLSAVEGDAQRLRETVQDLAGQVGELKTAAEAARAAQGQVRQLQETVAELAQRMEVLSPGRLSEELDQRAQQMDEARARVARLETQLAGWDAMEERTARALALADERRQAVEALKADLQRVFDVADGAVSQVRAVVELQQQIDQRHEALDPVLEKLRDLDRQGEALEARQKRFAEAEQHVARLDALLIDLQSTFQTVVDQKEFLERVVETAGNLALQTMQAEAAIATLREAAEAAKGKRAPA
jgi:chromosome segregation ATPase